MKTKNKKTLYLTPSRYNRGFILNYCLKQLINDGAEIITLNKNDSIKSILRLHRDNNSIDEIIEKQFYYSFCVSWSGFYAGFIYNSNYYYFQLDDNPFFEALLYKIKLDNNNNYIGMRYAYTENDLFKDDIIKDAIKINYFSGFEVFKKYSNKTLLKYARVYYENYFKKYILNIRDSEIVHEKKRVNNYYDGGFHYENIYDKKTYNIYTKH